MCRNSLPFVRLSSAARLSARMHAITLELKADISGERKDRLNKELSIVRMLVQHKKELIENECFGKLLDITTVKPPLLSCALISFCPFLRLAFLCGESSSCSIEDVKSCVGQLENCPVECG